MIQYRKQLLSCSQSSSSALITEIENIFSSHIVIHFEINPGMCSHYSVHIIHLKFSVSQTFALHYKARCVSIIGLAEGRYQRGAAPAPDSDKVSSINKYLHCLPLGNPGPDHGIPEPQGTETNEFGKHGYFVLGKYNRHMGEGFI